MSTTEQPIQPPASAGSGDGTPRSTTRWERKRRQKVQEILSVTARVLREHGYRNTNLDQIAQELDLTKASLYHYFDSKAALVHRCLESCHQTVLDRLMMAESREGTHAERLEALIREQLSILNEDWSDAVAMFVHPWDWPPEIMEEIDVWRREHDRIFCRVITAGVEAGEFTVSDPRIARYCLHGALNSTLSWFESRGASSDPARVDAVVDVLLGMFRPAAGLEPPSG